jgi:hypothetical protein
MNATNPARVFFGVVQQNLEEDSDCLAGIFIALIVYFEILKAGSGASAFDSLSLLGAIFIIYTSLS